MYTRDALLDTHTRAHRALTRLFAHCALLDAESLDRDLEGFGYPTVRLQLHHLIGAEEYWVSVLRGKIDAEDNPTRYTDVSALERFRDDVVQKTHAYLNGVSDVELNTRREMTTWGGHVRALVPAHILMRISTHIFQHQGQVLAQSRLLGKPGQGGTDFPLD